MRHRAAVVILLLSGCLVRAPLALSQPVGQVPARLERRPVELPPQLRRRCLDELRAGLAAEEFWPAMHAAEALTQAGHGDEVRAALAPRLTGEADGRRRCGLARELVRAGDRVQVRQLLAALAAADGDAHVHAAESLFKVGEIGDGRLLRGALEGPASRPLEIMAAAALARHGSRPALERLRQRVGEDDADVARLAAWALGRVGDRSDVPALESGARRAVAPPSRCVFEHALAALGDPDGRQALRRNLGHGSPAVRASAAEFAVDVRDPDLADDLAPLLDDPVRDVRIRAAHALLALSMPAPREGIRDRDDGDRTEPPGGDAPDSDGRIEGGGRRPHAG